MRLIGFGAAAPAAIGLIIGVVAFTTQSFTKLKHSLECPTAK
jgi:hypothetical protein